MTTTKNRHHRLYTSFIAAIAQAAADGSLAAEYDKDKSYYQHMGANTHTHTYYSFATPDNLRACGHPVHFQAAHTTGSSTESYLKVWIGGKVIARLMVGDGKGYYRPDCVVGQFEVWPQSRSVCFYGPCM